jgi:hypothetical protein
MPFAGFLCELSGEAISTDSCLACARAGAPGLEDLLIAFKVEPFDADAHSEKYEEPPI